MTGKDKKTQEEIHAKVDDAIISSAYTATASAGEIAKKLGVEKTLVARRFSVLGYVWNGTRWVKAGVDE